ncbi:FUSC family protein [Neobacillus sp. SM06]|uniref:FUSC family protein n=1 Tax=Neobacillus sp. SM06 TaxID=3422492 RepID=UPI003D275D72
MKPSKKRMENKVGLIWKMAVASAVSWEIAKWMGSNHPFLAPISVILCVQTTVKNSIRFSFHRMAGTIIGISVTVATAPYLSVNAWTIGLLILIGSFLVKWLKRDETAIHQAALTILLVFVIGLKSGTYFYDRFRDTLIGAMIAVLVNMFLYPPNFTKQAEQSFQHYSRHLTAAFLQTADWLQNGLEKKQATCYSSRSKNYWATSIKQRNLSKKLLIVLTSIHSAERAKAS